MSRTLAAESLARRLYGAENALDAALRDTSELLAGLTQARAEAGLSATTGRSVYRHVATSIEALVSAREGLCAAHDDLGRLARVLGIDPANVGPLDKPDDEPPAGGGSGGVGAAKLQKSKVQLG